MKKILSYRKTITHKLDDTWEWECPIWFSEGMFADAWVKGVRPFGTEREAQVNMEETMKKFGITKRTELL